MENQPVTLESAHKTLMILTISDLLMVVLFVLVCETGLVDLTVADPSENATTLFLTECIDQIVSIALIPLALYLFKFKKVHAELMAKKAEALQRWGIIRLQLLLLPLYVNIIVYYITMVPGYAYMAVILLIALVFVFPSKGRCEREISE